jgi:hypothetical protein
MVTTVTDCGPSLRGNGDTDVGKYVWVLPGTSDANMNELDSHELPQNHADCAPVAQFGWNVRLPSCVSAAIAVTAIVAYWAVGLVSACLCRDILSPAPWFFLYFAHYSALGGVLAGVFSKGIHATLWGAIAGAVLAGLLIA